MKGLDKIIHELQGMQSELKEFNDRAAMLKDLSDPDYRYDMYNKVMKHIHGHGSVGASDIGVSREEFTEIMERLTGLGFKFNITRIH